MFCRFCGKEIPDEAVFCHLCGKDQQIATRINDAQTDKAQDDQPAQPVVKPQPVSVATARPNDPSQYPVLHSVRAGAGRVGKAWAIYILFVAFIVFTGIILSLSFNSSGSVWSILAHLFFYIAISIVSVCFVVSAIRFTLVARSTNLKITEAGIYGVGGNRACRVRKNISFDYSQISRVYAQNDKMMFVEAGSETYCFPIDRAGHYADIIKELKSDYNS